jgi:hypothetical protein
MTKTADASGRDGERPSGAGAHRFVVVASRLPVDRSEGPDGEAEWRPSPGGLVSALEPVMRQAKGVWIGWSGDAGPAPGPFEVNGITTRGSATRRCGRCITTSSPSPRFTAGGGRRT